MIRTFLYSLKQAIVQIYRHKGMTLASLLSITAMLLILSLFFFVSVNVSFATENLKNQFDTIEVFLLDDTSAEQAQEMGESLVQMDGVAGVSLITKEMAMEEFKESWGDKAYMLDALSSNPLPNSLRVKLSSLDNGDMVAQVCRNMLGVEDVRYYQDEIRKILDIADALQSVTMVIIIVLVVISIVVVFNAVKINVMSRQKEIEIMKCVGATNWFIRGPLLVEGILLGALAAAISVGLSWFVYEKINALFGSQALMLFSTEFVDTAFMMENLSWIFMALGICIGSLGSILAARKFLKA